MCRPASAGLFFLAGADQIAVAPKVAEQKIANKLHPEEKVELLKIFPIEKAGAAVAEGHACLLLKKKSFKQAKLKIIPVR